jgi:hypothetical protein
MVAEVGAESNSTTVIMIPADFVHLAGNLSKFLEGKEGVGKGGHPARVSQSPG